MINIFKTEIQTVDKTEFFGMFVSFGLLGIEGGIIMRLQSGRKC